ncbi:MAG: hypothetical protein KBT69_07840, partial [Oceanihabitans sp.]|nr:hypothetical protein [Oceanihabitans sp.]
MKTKLLFLFFLPMISFAQVNANFEGVVGIDFSNAACHYVDMNTTSAHMLVNYSNSCGTVVVTESSADPNLGYITTLDPNTANGPAGFSDGDYFGVANASSVASQLGAAPPEGTQAFLMEDTDGTVAMIFDKVFLEGTVNPQVSLQYILDDTGWELEDFLKITVEISGCSTNQITLLDTTGSDIDALGIENSWNTLSADLSGYVGVGCAAQLIIEFSSNSASEELGIDNIIFTKGTTVEPALSNETFNLDNAFTVFPNPSNGNITIKN